MRFAYADPPYLGFATEFYGKMHDDAAEYNKPEAHRDLIQRLCEEFDGWALSLHAPALKTMLNFCPDDVRVAAWVKPFASFKPGVTRAYAWEPIILRGGRPIPKTEITVRDWIEAPAVKQAILMKKGFPGAKPAAVTWHIFDWLNMQPEDEFVDMFPGSGAVTDAHEAWLQAKSGKHQFGMFSEDAA